MSNTNLMDLTTKRPASRVNRERGYFYLPTFNRGTIFPASSDRNVFYVFHQWNYAASSKFTILNFTPPTFTYPNKSLVYATTVFSIYGASIKYRIGNQVFRYKLWNTQIRDDYRADNYTNQIIRPNFSIELWSWYADEVGSASGVINQPSLATPIKFETSITRNFTGTDLRTRADYSLDAGDVVTEDDLTIEFDGSGEIAIPVDSPAGSIGEDNVD